MQTQNKQLMQYLNKPGTYLTTILIVKWFDIASPTKRISEIKRSGYPIETRFVKKNGKRFAEWRKGND